MNRIICIILFLLSTVSITAQKSEIITEQHFADAYRTYSFPKSISTMQTPKSEERLSRPILALRNEPLTPTIHTAYLELETPIGRRWSVVTRCMVPWHTFELPIKNPKRHKIQFINSNFEGRYWLGHREPRLVMTGWFVGAYAGCGLYDFGYDYKGFQGECFISAGVTTGFAHIINRIGSLRMEYSLGIGYLRMNYRYYKEQFERGVKLNPFEEPHGKYCWLGPTRLKIALVWTIRQ